MIILVEREYLTPVEFFFPNALFINNNHRIYTFIIYSELLSHTTHALRDNISNKLHLMVRIYNFSSGSGAVYIEK